jgi:aminomethyltransferase
MTQTYKKTPLYNHHLKLNAQMVPFANYSMPLHYSSSLNETLMVRKDSGVFDVSHMGEILVLGKDSKKFVNFLITNDLDNLPMGKAIYSAVCNEEGGVIDDIIVYTINEEKTLICCNASNEEKIWSHLKTQLKKNQHLNVQLDNISEQTALLALQGPNSIKILQKLNLFNFDFNMTYYSVKEIKSGKNDVIFARTGYTGELGFEIFCSNDFSHIIWEKLMELGVTPCGLASRDILRLEMCYPLYGNELNEKTTPFEAGIKWTVKMKKENFIGKEALLSSYPQKKLIKFILQEGVPRHDYEICDSGGVKIGYVTSGTFSPHLKVGIGMGYIEKNFDAIEELNLFVRIRNQLKPIKIQNHSFLKGSHS